MKYYIIYRKLRIKPNLMINILGRGQSPHSILEMITRKTQILKMGPHLKVENGYSKHYLFFLEIALHQQNKKTSTLKRELAHQIY